MPHFETVAQVVTQAARELNLARSAIADPYVSTDGNILQMTALLTSAGREIVRDWRWSQRDAEHTFVTVQGTDNYPLPADFLRMIPQTHWNRTNRLPVGGPLSAEEWQYLNARLVGVVFNVLLRFWKGKWYLFPNNANTPGGYTIALEYMSSYWVGATASAGTKDAPTLATDVLFFDTHLMSRALKYHFLKAKGFPEKEEAKADYLKALKQVMDDDAPGRVLRLDDAYPVDPLIGQQNVPLTGFGS